MMRTKYAKIALRVVFSVIRFLLLSIVGVILIYPVYYSVSVAIRPVGDLYDPLVVLIPRSFTLENINRAIKYLDFPKAILNSVFLVVISTVLQIISCSMTGYGLARFRSKIGNIIFMMVILVIVVPPQTVIIPNYMQLRYFDPFGLVSLFNIVTGMSVNVNLIDKNAAFYLPAAFGMGIRSGIIIFIFRQFFRGMPKDLEEAAKIDGCGSIRTFARIMVPNAGGAYLTTFLFSVVWYWNDYVYTSSYLSNTKTVMNMLNKLYANIEHIFQYELEASPYEGILLLQAGVLLAIAPLLIIYIVLQRFFTESIERSGIVG